MADLEKRADSLSLSRDLHGADGGVQATLLPKGEQDLEAQRVLATDPYEYTVSTRMKLSCLALYFFFNLGLTLSNKSVLQYAKFPWLLTLMHATTTSLGCAIMLKTGQFRLTKLARNENFKLIAFSSLFTLNIAISNVSLEMVSIAFHQVLRSTVPVATILIYAVIFRRQYARSTYMSIIPLICGVAIATYGDYDFTISGFSVTMLGVFLAAAKVIATNRLLTGQLKLSSLELLFRMSPLAACQCAVYAWITGEMGQFRVASADDQIFTSLFLFGLLMNAVTAFALNVISFQTNKVAGALTISVCANIKPALTILFGILLFHVPVTTMSILGTVITMLGGAWYSKVELDVKRSRRSF